MKDKTFSCPVDSLDFEAEGYDNPVFLADTVANCPKCGGKSWEKTYQITKSEFERLEALGVEPRLFN